MGVIFEMPILVFFLAFMGIMTPSFMIKNFRYAILVIFILAAIVTPTTGHHKHVRFRSADDRLVCAEYWRGLAGSSQPARGAEERSRRNRCEINSRSRQVLGLHAGVPRLRSRPRLSQPAPQTPAAAAPAADNAGPLNLPPDSGTAASV